MERRFVLRKAELLADCQVHPAVFAGMMERLDQFAEPFASWLRMLDRLFQQKSPLSPA
jgi:hypothetical protein